MAPLIYVLFYTDCLISVTCSSALLYTRLLLVETANNASNAIHFQGLFAVLSRFLCGPSTHVLSLESAAAIAAGPGGAAISSAAAANAANAANAATDAKTAFKSLALRRPDLSKGPGWPIIVGFTLAFAATYPVHMYVAEVYVTENFSFLLVKYCVGFLFVLFVPLITLVLEEEIR